MLRQVLQELQSSPGPVNLDDLSRKLGVQRSALDGMIAFWVRKGRLKDMSAETSIVNCVNDACPVSCPGAQGCTSVK